MLWKYTSLNGILPVNSSDAIIILATQKKIISAAVERKSVGKYFFRSGVSSGQPIVENGHSQLENHVSSTSGSCSQFSISAGGFTSQ